MKLQPECVSFYRFAVPEIEDTLSTAYLLSVWLSLNKSAFGFGSLLHIRLASSNLTYCAEHAHQISSMTCTRGRMTYETQQSNEIQQLKTLLKHRFTSRWCFSSRPNFKFYFQSLLIHVRCQSHPKCSYTLTTFDDRTIEGCVRNPIPIPTLRSRIFVWVKITLTVSTPVGVMINFGYLDWQTINQSGLDTK